jgi:hypothetical protein
MENPLPLLLMRPRALCYLQTLVVSVLSGCLYNAEADEPDLIAAQSSALIKSNAFGWSRDPNGVTTTVPVCWDERDYPHGPAEPTRTALKDFVRRAIEETWQRESGLIFSGWGDTVARTEHSASICTCPPTTAV